MFSRSFAKERNVLTFFSVLCKRTVDKQNCLLYQYKPSDVLNKIVTPLTLVRTGGLIQDKAACQN